MAIRSAASRADALTATWFSQSKSPTNLVAAL
jgi:hypothetical protein